MYDVDFVMGGVIWFNLVSCHSSLSMLLVSNFSEVSETNVSHLTHDSNFTAKQGGAKYGALDSSLQLISFMDLVTLLYPSSLYPDPTASRYQKTGWGKNLAKIWRCRYLDVIRVSWIVTA